MNMGAQWNQESSLLSELWCTQAFTQVAEVCVEGDGEGEGGGGWNYLHEYSVANYS